jgi:aspartate-semialdehyde dehydrogenase
LSRRTARIALVGATGTVGSQIAELLGERNFPYSELKLFARESSGRLVDAGEKSLPVDSLDGVQGLSEFDIVFLAVPRSFATEIIEKQPGPVLIDLSAATIPPSPTVPMLAPGLTAREQAGGGSRGGVFAVPHPAAQVIATILRSLRIEGFAAGSVMLSVSMAGHQGVSNLFQQSADLLNARLDLDDEPQVAFNVFPAHGARELAQAFAAQIRVLGVEARMLLLDVISMPAFHGNGISLFLPPGDAKGKWPELLRAAPGLIVVTNDDAAGFVDTVGQDGAIVRISMDDAGASIWCALDAARLAALTAVWIAETISGTTSTSN